MFFRFCWNTPLGRVSRGFCDWLMCSILGFKELTDSSRSRSPSWRLLLFPPTHPNLEGEICLVVPPVSLIVRAIHYLHVSRAVATLVVPFWPSSYFWPIISRKFSRFVVGYKCFEATALEQGRNINSFLGSDRFTGFILAVLIKFS